MFRLALVVWTCLVIVSADDLDLVEGDLCKNVNGTQWTCKQINECPKAIKDLKERGKRSDVCGFQGLNVVVCCEPEVKMGSGEKAKEMCNVYMKQLYEQDPTVATGWGTNGEDAKHREFPHMALIGYGSGNSIDWLCGGSLVSDRFVLSAAHCDASIKGNARWVRLGEYNFRSDEDEHINISRTVEYEIIERIIHPDYNSSSYYNDIALFKLNTSVVFNEYIKPTCLHAEYVIPEGNYTATGWGITEWQGKQSSILQKMTLFITSKQECRDTYNIRVGTKLKDGIRDESMICAGDDVKGTDTCPGDSGGPLQTIQTYDNHRMYLQVGITSFGYQCGGNKPGVYTRVSHYISWIESVVWS